MAEAGALALVMSYTLFPNVLVPQMVTEVGAAFTNHQEYALAGCSQVRWVGMEGRGANQEGMEPHGKGASAAQVSDALTFASDNVATWGGNPNKVRGLPCLPCPAASPAPTLPTPLARK